MKERLLSELDSSLVIVDERGGFRVSADGGPANAVWFECPCGDHNNLIAFEPTLGDAPISEMGLSTTTGRPWKRTSGSSVNDLTLSPSIAISNSKGECWHGFITNGSVTG